MRHLGTSASVLIVYVAVAVVYTWPLAAQAGTFIASDPGDPILNTTILWWNATVLPFTGAWWNPPYFHPATGVAAFTEHLTGIGVIATPVLWMTDSPLAAYNASLFATWPLSAFAAYLLVLFLTRRHDAAFVGGLAYGFTPYRIAELGHLQSLTSYWLPLALLGLHGFARNGRRRWLGLFGAGWLLQSLSNGYFMLQGGVLLACWMLYFLSKPDAWSRVPPVLAAWAVASLPLAPVMLRYYTIHEHYGMERSLNETLAFSAPAWAWFEVSPLVALWYRILPEADDKLFPGLTVVVLVSGGMLAAFRRRGGEGDEAGWRPRARLAAVLLGLACLTAIGIVLAHGPVRVSLAGFAVRISDIGRALGLLLVAAAAWILLTGWTRGAIARRSALAFYAAATLLMGVFCWGPVLRAGEHVVLDPAPYRWLMYLPGFDSLRVPTRFWMLGVLCLSAAAGLGLARLTASGGWRRRALTIVAALGVMADGWLRLFPMAAPPEPWPAVERPDVQAAVIELPLGPAWDAAATYRSMWHRRPVVNGVSGYDPAHYGALRGGLEARDPEMWPALRSFGEIEAVVDADADPGDLLDAYVREAGRGIRVASDGARTAYRIEAPPMTEPVLGEPLPIINARASHNGGPVSMIFDGRVDDEWQYPHRPGQWLVVDLGQVTEVAGITHAMGRHPHDYPRLLRVEVSTDGWNWETAWEGATAARAFLAAARAPRHSNMPIAFPGRQARFVRLRQLGEHGNLWRVAEVSVHRAREPV